MPGPAFLLDADAVIHLHSLGLVDSLCEALRGGRLALHCTRYVWEHELAALRDVRERLLSAGLVVHTLTPRSPAGELFKKLLRDRGNLGHNSKGELELIAFAATVEFQVTIVADDEGARKMTGTHRVDALDLADFLCALVCDETLSEAVVASYLAPWDNPHAGNGRPRGYDGFASWLSRWKQRRPRGPVRSEPEA